MDFINNFINGLNLGSIYALIALGYTMVYGIAKMLNFAHGDIIMVGAFAVITFAALAGLNIWLSLLLAVTVCVTLGILIERIAYKPLREASSLAVLITAIGVSYFLQNLALLIFGSTKRNFPSFITLSPIEAGGLYISSKSIITLVLTTLIMVALTIFIKKSQTGRAMLAVSEDKGAAKLMGINVNKTIAITFAIGSSLAAVAGICYGYTYTFIGPYTGSMPGIKAFVAAVIGGIGSIPGAMIGGIILGIIEILVSIYISSEWSEAIVFGILILVLIVKPTGIMGKKINEKV